MVAGALVVGPVPAAGAEPSDAQRGAPATFSFAAVAKGSVLTFRIHSLRGHAIRSAALHRGRVRIRIPTSRVAKAAMRGRLRLRAPDRRRRWTLRVVDESAPSAVVSAVAGGGPRPVG